MTANAPNRDPERLPLTVLTGFLGSGKTTLLNELLKSPAAADAAVIINELGEIGLDHALLEKVDGETVLLESGCVCCTVRNDLMDTITRLFARRRAGEVPPFRRLVLETTGLADPAPIVYLLMSEPAVAGHAYVSSVVCTVDAMNGAATLARHHESVRQIAMADRLVLTKTDMAPDAAVTSLVEALRALNLAAPIVRRQDGVAAAELLEAGLYDPQSKTPDVQRWLGEEAKDARPGWHDAHAHDHDACDEHEHHEHAAHHHGHEHDRADRESRHRSSIRTFHVVLEQPLAWSQLSEWLGTLNEFRGDALLRVKGILNVQGYEGPVVVHGVQQLIHVPTVLPAWPDADHRSRIVFIVDGLDAADLKRGLETH